MKQVYTIGSERYVKLEKIAEERPNENGIDIGYVRVGKVVGDISVGSPVVLRHKWGTLVTTEAVDVKPIHRDVLQVKTTNSTYTLTSLKGRPPHHLEF